MGENNTDNVQAQKKSSIREDITKKLHAQDKTQRLHKSRLIREQLLSLAEFKRAECVMFYVSTEEEVDTIEALRLTLKLGKKVVIPVVAAREKKMIASQVKDIEEELSPGPFGILEPRAQFVRQVNPREIDLVVVPAVAFDEAGNRLGRGKGYYDRFLSRIPKKTLSVGLAFDFQVVKDLPVLSHDIAVSKVISA